MKPQFRRTEAGIRLLGSPRQGWSVYQKTPWRWERLGWSRWAFLLPSWVPLKLAEWARSVESSASSGAFTVRGPGGSIRWVGKEGNA